jgi:cell shape-determining protein MreC
LALGDSEEPQDHILSEKAWITYSYLDQIAKDPQERLSLLLSAVKMLQDASETNVEARVRLGTIIHTNGDEIEMKGENTKWLQALKIQSGN